MTHLHAHSCHRQSAYISHECEWQWLHNISNEYKNNSDSCWHAELTVKLLTTSWA